MLSLDRTDRLHENDYDGPEYRLKPRHGICLSGGTNVIYLAVL